MPDALYLINVLCIVVSWKFATMCFKSGNKTGGYFNLFASAFNAVVVVRHFA